LFVSNIFVANFIKIGILKLVKRLLGI